MKKQLENMLRKLNYIGQVIPASSFSASMNLIHESDIDFNVIINKYKLEDLEPELKKIGFIYNETRNKDNDNIHRVYQKFVKNNEEEIEIEFKLRENSKYYLETLGKVHDFLDNKLSTQNKKIITFIKLKLKELKDNKEYYNSFKVFYYHYGQAGALNNELLYPLVKE